MTRVIPKTRRLHMVEEELQRCKHDCQELYACLAVSNVVKLTGAKD